MIIQQHTRYIKDNDIAAKLHHGRLVGIIKILHIEDHPVFEGKILMTYEYLEMSDFVEHIGQTFQREFNQDGSSFDGGGITHKWIKSADE